MLRKVKAELEKKITEIRTLHCKYVEKVEKYEKLYSQFDESVFNGSRIEQELENTKKDFLALQNQFKDRNENSLDINVQLLQMQRELDNERFQVQIKSLEIENLKAQCDTAERNEIKEQLKKLQEYMNVGNSQMENKKKSSAHLTSEPNVLEKKHIKNQYAHTRYSRRPSRSKILTGFSVNENEPKKDGDSKLSVKDIVDNTSEENVVRNLEYTVLIVGVNPLADRTRLKEIVLKLAEYMKLDLTPEYIYSVQILQNKNVVQSQKGGNRKLSLVVEFNDLNKKVKFLSHKKQLNNNPLTSHLHIREYNTSDVNSLYHRAIVLRNYGYKVYCRNNVVVAGKPLEELMKLSTIDQIDDLIKKEKDIKKNILF